MNIDEKSVACTVSVIEINFEIAIRYFLLEQFENPFQIMQDSILVRKRTKLVSARSPARVPVFLQLAQLNL